MTGAELVAFERLRDERGAAGGPVTPAVEACLRAVERVEQVLDLETGALKARAPADLADFNRRKSHGLLELSRAMRGVERHAAQASLEPRLRVLQSKLRDNAKTLRTHLDAVQEIAALMTRAMRDAESDGTYTANVRLFPAAR